jgi:hypothetical protein
MGMVVAQDAAATPEGVFAEPARRLVLPQLP